MAGYIGVQPVPKATQRREYFTATSNQTTFNTSGYTPDYVDVYMNGVKLSPADFTATNGSDVVLASGAATGDLLQIISFLPFQAASQTFTGGITSDGGVSIDNITIDGTEIDLSSGDLTLDVAGDISLDADGGQIRVKDGGAEFGVFSNSSGDFIIASQVQDKDIIFQGNDGGSGITAMTIDMSAGGNVGIKTTLGSSFTQNASSDLVIGAGSGNSGMTLFSGTSSQGAISFADGTASDNTQYRGYINYAHNLDALLFGVSGAEKVRIDSSGNVGIGTSSPDKPLEVVATNTAMKISGSGVSSTGLVFETNGVERKQIGVPSGSTDLVFFSDAGSTRAMTINSSGNVGIGTTSPETIIHATATSAIARLTSATNGTSGVDFGDSDDTNIGRILYDNSDNSMAFTTNASERMRIDASGNVGIGTTSPNHDLHLHKSTSDGNFLLITNSTTGSNNNDGAAIGLAADETLLIYHQESSAIRFGTASTERMRITSGGKVGIGTTSPATALDVDGGANTDQATFSGTAGRGLKISTFSVGAADEGVDFDAQASGTTQALTFSTGGTERVRVDGSGNLILKKNLALDMSTSEGIDFGAAGSSANTLDDYEEGTSTPGFKDGVGNVMGVSNPVGSYVKVGTLLHCMFTLTRNDSDNHTGNLQVTGFPFTPYSATNLVRVTGGMWVDNGSTNDIVSSIGYLGSGNTLYGVMDNRITSTRYIQANELTNGRPVYGYVTFRTT